MSSRTSGTPGTSGYQPRRVPQGAPPLRNSDAAIAAAALKENELAEHKKAQKQQAHTGKATQPVHTKVGQVAPTGKAGKTVHTNTKTHSQVTTPTTTTTTTTTTIQKEKKPFYKKTLFIICVVIILLGLGLGIGLGLGLKSNTDTPDASEPTYTSTSRSSTPTAPTTTAPTPTTTEPTTTSVSLTQGPAPPPPSNPSVFLPRKLDDNGKVILYDIDVIKNVGKPENDVYNIIYENNNIKELETPVTFNSPYGNKNYIGKIKIKNCKINLKRTYFDKNGERHDASENFYNYMNDDNWTEVPLNNDSFISYYGDIKIPNYYTSAIITIMSEIILLDEKQKLIINSNINNINITQEIVIPNILISGFKIKNCTITLYSVNEVVEYSSSSKKESYLMEILPTVYNKIKIVPNRI